MQKNLLIILMIIFIFIPQAQSQTAKAKLRKEIPSISQNGKVENNDSKLINSHWQSMGPEGMPNPLGGGNTYGQGQINRLAFDPEYDGISNKTIYACSFFGGLWRSENDGDNWQNVNTDFLPSTSVADVCINPFDNKEIFICTGYGDGGIYDARGPNWAHINFIPTTGIFRSKDYGETWEDISGNFLDSFDNDGMCRKMAINPFNPDQILVATTKRVFKTENASSENVVWKNVFENIDPELRDIRGLAFKPDDSNTIYASGKDIFVSKDGGETWQKLSGQKYDLDMNKLPENLKVRRINIAVSPAAPNRLYAYIIGEKEIKNKTLLGAHIAIFENDKWRIIETRITSGLTYFADHWIAIAVSPIDANAVYYANTRLIGSENIDSTKFELLSPYCGNGFHADVHDLAFQPNVENPKLYCANHGGVSLKTFTSSKTGGWEYKNKGLEVALIWAFDDSEHNEDVVMVGTQDNGSLLRYDTLGNMWHFIHGGDGATGRIDIRYPDLVYYSPSDHNLYSYDLKTFKRTNEAIKLPMDPRNTKKRITTSKTTFMENHPKTQQAWFGFTEVYSKSIDFPSIKNKPDEVWTRQSDIYKTEPFSWRRQITEIAFCKAQPENIFVVTGGQQNSPWTDWHLPSGLYKSNQGGLDGKDEDEIRFKPLDFPGKNYDDDTLAIITSIAVAPYNPNHVWISYTGIPKAYRVWFSMDGGISWKNDDPKGILADNPVNAIAYQEGSADRIYLGTDKGLFTRNRFTDWQKVEDFPSVRITELKIKALI